MAVDSPMLRWYRIGLLVLGAAVLGVAAWYFLRDQPSAPPDNQVDDRVPPDPRITFETPFRNVRPDVEYVGDAKCAQCHDEIDKPYHAHPMGRSAESASRATPIERYDATAHNPSAVGPYELWVERTKDKVLHHVRAKDSTGKPLPDYIAQADLAIGSGTRGRSYLTVDRGAVWQSPISWYGPEARWDLSPGFDLGNGGRRPIVPECLFCHVDRVEPVPLAVNRYKQPVLIGQASIGCERCHGPGSLHVAERSSGALVDKIDYSIVNPKHLSAELQAGICAQCHLQAEQRVPRRGRSVFEYRPGLPLEMFITYFVRHPDIVDLRKSVGQFEQMQVSRCFTESNGQLGCTSCHEPHSRPAAGTQGRFYAKKCQSCHGHGSKECSERIDVRQARDDSCVACHMPTTGSSNIAHTSITDHRIPRRPNALSHSSGLPPGTVPFIAFPIGKHGAAGAELERDLGVALSHASEHISANDANVRLMIASLAEDRLRTSVTKWRTDLPAWLALGSVYDIRSNPDGFLEAATTAAALAPESEEGQAMLASAAAGHGKFDVAIGAASNLLRMNPSSVDLFALRASIYVRMEDWKKAEADCRAGLAIHPLYPRLRLLLAISLYHLGDRAGGRREADTAANLATSERQKAAFLELYRAQTR